MPWYLWYPGQYLAAVGRPSESAVCLAAREQKKLRKERSFSERRLLIGFFTPNSKSYAASDSLSLVAQVVGVSESKH